MAAECNIGNAFKVYQDGTAWDDLRIVPGAFDFPGTADPTLVGWQPGGSGATFRVYEFAKNDEAFALIQLPHHRLYGSDLKPHIHWTPGANGATENGNLVGWKVDYSMANIGSAFPASTTVDLQDACNGVNHEHNITASGTITGTGIGISAMLMLRIYRSDTGADDTWSGSVTGSLPLLLEFDLHYQIDAPGSDAETSKDA